MMYATMIDVDELANFSSQVLENEHFQRIIQQHRADAIKKFEDSRPDQQHIREEAYNDLQAVNRLQASLKRNLDNQKLRSKKR